LLGLVWHVMQSSCWPALAAPGAVPSRHFAIIAGHITIRTGTWDTPEANLMCCPYLLRLHRSKIAGTIKRDSLSITRLPAQGRPAKAVLELLRAKEARNIRISPGG
jgi:hypothetical protein